MVRGRGDRIGSGSGNHGKRKRERDRALFVNKKKTKGLLRYLLESAGEGGFIVSGLMQSEGDGERSRFVVTWLSPLRERPAQWPRLSERPLRLVEWAR